MLTRHAAGPLRLCTLLALVLPMLPGQVAAAPPRQGPSSALMVYHELTLRRDGSLPIESPVLSGDGRRAIWAESPAVPKQSGRVYALDIDGGQAREIDAYAPLCACRPWVDVSDDGNTVVSTEGVRIRVLDGGATFGRKREVLRLADNVILALRISGDGRIIVFMVLRDTTISEPNPLKRGAPIPRGIWAVSAEGGEPIQLAGIGEVAAVAGVPVAELEADPNFYNRTVRDALDVSDDGRRIIFGARAGNAGNGVFSISEGSPLTKLIGPVPSVRQVAVSGDGQTVAFATANQLDTTVTVMAGGTPKSLPTYEWFEFVERLQLSRDGSKLLAKSGSRDTILVEVATLATRQLIPDIPPSVLAEGVSPRLFTGGIEATPTMNAVGTRVLYVAHPDAENRGDLAIIDLDTTNPGGAPLIRGMQVDPDTIPDDGSKSASVSTQISWDGALIGVWLQILRDGLPDYRIGSSLVELQDTVGPDPRRLRGIFAADVAYSKNSNEGTVPGLRHLRLMIASQAADGRQQGTVFDADKTLTVGGMGLGSHYRGEVAVGDAQIAALLPPTDFFKELRDLRAAIQLDPATNTLLGGSLSYEGFMVERPLRIVFSGAALAESSLPFDVLPGGILGHVNFQGERTVYATDGSVVDASIDSLERFNYASDPTGQVVLCATGRTVWTLEDAELRRQECVANAVIALRPVQAAPPVA